MMLDRICIRRPLQDDYKSMAEILVDGWRSAYVKIVPQEYLDNLSVEHAEKSMIENKKGNAFMVVEVNNEVVAFCRYSLKIAADKQDGFDGTISELYVKPELKGKGIGGALLKRVLDDFKQNGNCCVILGCFSQNESSLLFYEKMGGQFIYEKDIEIGAIAYATSFYQFDIQNLMISNNV